MANYQLLKADIDKKVYQNGAQEITGANLNSVLNEMVTTLGAEYQFAGVATIDTNPGTPDAKVFYIANGKGTYTNFGGINVTEDEVVVLYWDTAWHKEATGIASQDKLTELASKIVEIEIVSADADATIGKLFTLNRRTIYYKVAEDNYHIVLPIPEDGYEDKANRRSIFVSGSDKYVYDGVELQKLALDKNLLTKQISLFTNVSSERVCKRIKELYLHGIDTSKKYYVDFVRYFESGEYKVAQIYVYSYTAIDKSDKILVSMYEGITLSGLVILAPQNNSGVLGYAVINITTNDTDIQSADIDNILVASLSNSPYISAFLSENIFISASNNAKKRLVAIHLDGLDKSKRYYCSQLRYYTSGEYKVAQVYINEYTTSQSSSTIVAFYEGIILNGVVKIVESNNSGISGMAIINIDTLDSDNETPELNSVKVSDNFEPFNYWNAGIKKDYYVGEGKEYARLRDAIADAIVTNGSKVFVCGGTYNLLEEFATEIAAGPTSQIGICLDNDVEVIFQDGAKVTCLYAEANENINQFLSPFYSGSKGGFIMRNAIIKASNCRYCVHDDPSLGSTKYRKVGFYNCRMEFDDTGSFNNYYPQCIGGGMTNSVDVEIIGCYFETKRSETSEIPAVSYHNTSATNKSYGVFHIHDCYFADKSTYHAYYYGDTPYVSKSYVSGCKMGSLPRVMATGSSTIVNMEIISWGNEITN